MTISAQPPTVKRKTTVSIPMRVSSIPEILATTPGVESPTDGRSRSERAYKTTRRTRKNYPPRDGATERFTFDDANGRFTRVEVKSKTKWATSKASATVIAYKHRSGIHTYVDSVNAASPLDRIQLEKTGVEGEILKDLAKALDLPAGRMFEILGIPKATAEKKAKSGEFVGGNGGHAILGIVRLLGVAKSILASSTSEKAEDFDIYKWLGHWLETAQPALNGACPADLIQTPTGVDVSARLLGAIESGSYQ